MNLRSQGVQRRPLRGLHTAYRPSAGYTNALLVRDLPVNEQYECNAKLGLEHVVKEL
jgi:hypothetical protein